MPLAQLTYIPRVPWTRLLMKCTFAVQLVMLMMGYENLI